MKRTDYHHVSQHLRIIRSVEFFQTFNICVALLGVSWGRECLATTTHPPARRPRTGMSVQLPERARTSVERKIRESCTLDCNFQQSVAPRSPVRAPAGALQPGTLVNALAVLGNSGASTVCAGSRNCVTSWCQFLLHRRSQLSGASCKSGEIANFVLETVSNRNRKDQFCMFELLYALLRPLPLVLWPHELRKGL